MKLKRLKMKKHPDLECFQVELRGLEPRSKRGINLLSTCLSSPLVVGSGQDRSHQPKP